MPITPGPAAWPKLKSGPIPERRAKTGWESKTLYAWACEDFRAGRPFTNSSPENGALVETGYAAMGMARVARQTKATELGMGRREPWHGND